MNDEDLSREELLKELALLRGKVSVLEQTCDRLLLSQRPHTEKEPQYRIIVDNLTAGVFVSNLDGVLLYANPALVRLSGYETLEEFLTVPVQQIYAYSADRDNLIAQLLRTGTINKAEVRVLRKDGTVHWIYVSAVLQRTETGEPARIIGTVEDITGLKESEELLRDSELRFRLAFDTSPDGIAIAREDDGVYVAVNKGLTNLLGYSESKIIGNSSLALNIWNNPSDRALLRHSLAIDSLVENLEVQFRTKDGAVRTGLMSARIISMLGEPHILSVTRDIEEWKKTKAMLHETEQRFVRLLENTDTGLLIVDMSGRVISANNHYARMAGAQSFSELLGRPVLDWTAPESVEANAAAVALCAAEGSVSDFETVYLRPDGTRAHILVDATLEAGEHGSCIATLCRDITERRQTEEEREAARKKIQEQNEFLTTVIESLPHPFYVMNATSFEVMLANSAAKEAGLTSGVACYTAWHDRTEPCVGLPYVCPLKEVLITQKPSTVQHEHLDKDGERRSVRVQAYPIIDPAGQVTSVIAYAVDVTEEKNAKERFLESEERFRKFADEVSFEGIIIHDQGKILYVNPVFARMYGYHPAELIGMDSLAIIAEESRNLVSENIRLEFEETYEAISLRKDGTVFPTEIHAKAIPFAGGVVRAAAVRDLTKRVQAEKAVRESESRFRSLFEAATEFVEILDETGRILEANPAFVKGIGWSHDHIVGRRIDEFFSPTSKELFHLHFPSVLNSGVCSAEIDLVAADGRIITVDCTASAIRGASGNTKYVVIAQRDLTEHKRLEEQLRQAVKMEAIGRLAGGVAHDFNNLLTAIMGYCTMLMQRLPQEGDHVQKLAQINLASERAAALTQQLLAFSRKQVLRMRVLDINIVISDIGEMLRRLIGEHIDLVMVPNGELQTVRADQGQIEQIVVNLVVNARDAMPRGGKLTIETARVVLDEEYAKFHVDVDAGPYVLISVSDDGVGMDMATRSRIFEPFFTTKGKGLGTGLGLSTVYGIVRQHGGHISVYSEPGVGTTFKVYLPCVAEAPEEVPVTEPVLHPSHGAETVLVVEDEEIVRNMATEFLLMVGYSVLSVGDPEDALRLSEEHPGPIDLLLTDVILPKMDGRTLSQSILDKRPQAKVLYVSGYTENAIVHHGVLDPGINFLKKPFGMEALAQKVREVLDSQPADKAHSD